MTAPKKSLGQHWLVNRGVAERIVDAAELSPEHTVLEVGPGRGALTGLLAGRAGTVIAVEKDGRLIPELRTKFSGSANVRIVQGDILKNGPHAVGIDGPYTVVANLPYYITSRFLRVLLSSWPPPERAVIMLPKDVARRISARPPDMNMLALSVQAYAVAESIMDVSPGSFSPPPEVESSVIRLESRASDGESRERAERALAVAKRAFGHKRKQLGGTFPAGILISCGIRPEQRPQELTWEQWNLLSAQGR